MGDRVGSLPRALHKPWTTCNEPTIYHLHHPIDYLHHSNLHQHHLPRPTPQLRPPTPHQHPHLQQLQKVKKKKKSKNSSSHITIPKRHAPTNVFPATDFRLKRLKKSPLPFQHHKAILQPDHNTNPKSSHITTTTKPPPLNPEITQKTQPNSTNTPSSLTVATTTANTATTTTNHIVNTSYTSNTTGTTTTTNTSTQTDTPIPALMQLNIPIQSRIYTPSTSITIPLSPSIAHSSIAPSPTFPRTLQDLQRLGLWGVSLPTDRQPKEVTITWRF